MFLLDQNVVLIDFLQVQNILFIHQIGQNGMQQRALYILQYQSDTKSDQLINQEHVTQLISDDQLFASFNNIRDTPKYYKNMLLDVLVKVYQFGVYTFLHVLLLNFTGLRIFKLQLDNMGNVYLMNRLIVWAGVLN